ncbi:MAG: dihydroneopterin triphosphate diphosphatase [Pseudomonadota bacterium]|nr:dihydroneopterin triphosphate diphosphatase [Pseudomonadota bacterium]
MKDQRSLDEEPLGAHPARVKIPESVLVVIHTAALDVLLLERADAPGFWQSVTGSKDRPEELLTETCRREVHEETGFDLGAHAACLRDWRAQNVYAIYARWRHRYAAGVTDNTEHVFSLLVPSRFTPTLAPREHAAYEWLAWDGAAARCFSPTNAAAIRQLPALA